MPDRTHPTHAADRPGAARPPSARRAEALYGSVIALASDAIVVTDADQRILLFNRGAEETFGYAAHEVIGRPLDVLLPTRFTERHRTQLVPEFGGGTVAARRMAERSEVYGRRRNGEEFPAEIAISHAVVDGERHYSAIVRDISERRARDEALRASEQRFRGIFDSSFQFVGLIALDGTVLEANAASLAFVGACEDDVLGRPFWDTPWWRHSRADRQRLRDGVARAARGAFVRFEAEHHGVDGRTLLVDFSLKPVTNLDGEVTLLIAEGRDVTESRRMAARLRESEETIRSAFEHSSIGMGLAGLDGRWQRVNGALCRITGYDEAELLARRFTDITHPDDMGRDLACIAELVDGTRDSYEMEKRYVRKDGAVVWGHLTGSLVRAPDGTPRFFIRQVQDITKRKRAEEALERQRAELSRSNTELEQFAYVASHDLQEPLRAVASYTQLLAERYAPQLDERAQKYVRYAVQGAERMHALINDLLELSRVGTRTAPFAAVDLGEVVDEMLRAMELAIADVGAVVTRDALPVVWGDASQLGQALQNLVANALKFRRPDVPPRVHVSAEAGEAWTISVRDNGIGIDPTQAERVFVIFQRLHTRDEYAGTGIGLAICRKVVERHGGRIWVEPSPDGGSAFRFTLPLRAAAEERTPVVSR